MISILGLFLLVFAKLSWQVFLSCILGRVDAFLNSDQNRAATRLLSAYTDGDIEEIKRAAQSSVISNIDNTVNPSYHILLASVFFIFLGCFKLKKNQLLKERFLQIIKLARKLPTGDYATSFKRGTIGEKEDQFDEDDLT